MQKNTSVTLGSHFNSFIKSQVEAGRFSSASEAVRAGLRLLEEREAKVAILRQKLADGEKSGFIDDFNMEDVIHDLNRGNDTDQSG